MSVMFSRSGHTSQGGKLDRRIDVPLSEDLHDMVVVKAAASNKPKAEFARQVLQDALLQPLVAGLPDSVQSKLRALAELTGMTANDLAAKLLTDSVEMKLSMTRSIALQQVLGQSDELPEIHGCR